MAKEILGPRGGSHERLEGRSGSEPPDPSDEYVVGVLEPKDYQRSVLAHYRRSDITGSQDVARMDEGEKFADEDEDYEYGDTNAGITPELDPRALPKSIGLSFVVSSQGTPRISFCVTWARYIRKGSYWERNPLYHIEHDVSCDNEGSWRSGRDRGVEIRLKKIKLQDGIHVSLYVINTTPVSGPGRLKVEDLIFQPQIRVVCGARTEIVPIRGYDEEQEEDHHDDGPGFGLLYYGRYAKARGHLCSAIWKEVDPERPIPSKASGTSDSDFKWIDEETLPLQERSIFRHPDVRTEYLPCYSVEQAYLNGPESEKLTQIPANYLADSWEPDRLGDALKPIIEAYERWIEHQREGISSLPRTYWKSAEANLEKCYRTLVRIKEGLTLLLKDDDARLAFCFMNKAMYLQSVWKKPDDPLKWYPFQIAFILQCVPGVLAGDHPSRNVCDLLWFPTGAGKTEAYLGLTAFTLAIRRRRAIKSKDLTQGGGVSVISRYTLRLLTIQQYRRALSMITACEYLRSTSWLPPGDTKEENPWGTLRFSIGLWVGAGVTPNHLVDLQGFDPDRKKPVLYPGAVGELYGRKRLSGANIGRVEGEESEPAQVLKCPACNGVLAVSPTTFGPGEHKINWVVSCKTPPAKPPSSKPERYRSISTKELNITPLPSGNSYVVTVKFAVAPSSEVNPDVIDSWWFNVIKPLIGQNCVEEFARPSRPGYFFRRSRLTGEPVDFEIHCPNPDCALNKQSWSEVVPTSETEISTEALPPFRTPGKRGVAYGIPIPAYTVDDQVYGRCPSMVVATVDKFARLAFEPHAAALFGNVTHYDSLWGYYRESVPPETGGKAMGKSYPVPKFDPPELIIQDELHLIEGPLGTMVGLYETGIEALASSERNGKTIRPKYVASTATIRQAGPQVKALFDRTLSQFPPPGLTIDDSFFAISREPHPMEVGRPGRLYVGVCAPGRGVQTLIVRIWSVILQEMAYVRKVRGSSDREADQFWTVVGYFNAKRELAGAVGLFKADIRERLGVLAARTGTLKREPLEHVELSGRTESFEIPGKLDRLSKFPDNDVDAVFATAMFGTGVDIDRLGLMIVHGQPKTTANYIQATGRVGRQSGGLVVTILRATRPRDLDHYEFFVGYHRSLQRHVEPVTVYPFSPRARERGLGPLSVLLLRNASLIAGISVPSQWAPEDRNKKGFVSRSGSRTMASRRRSGEVSALIDVVGARVRTQPEGRNPGEAIVTRELSSELDRWEAFAIQRQKDLVYSESSMVRNPSLPVVLGDPEHDARRLPQVFRNAPQSLRDVEATTTFDDGE